MLAAVNGMLLDMLAVIARKDYVDRRRRQADGIAKAKAAGRFKGRPEHVCRNAGIAARMRAGSPWQQIEQAFWCGRNTSARVRKRLDAAVMAAQARSGAYGKGSYRKRRSLFVRRLKLLHELDVYPFQKSCFMTQESS